jgi:hypothetical protein
MRCFLSLKLNIVFNYIGVWLFFTLTNGCKCGVHPGPQGKGMRFLIQVLISRNYRGDIPMSSIEKFMPLILQVEEEESATSPIVSQDGIHFLYIRHNNLFRIYYLISRFHDQKEFECCSNIAISSQTMQRLLLY